MSELFDLPESKSPRLQWMERHGITVRRYGPHDCGKPGWQDNEWFAMGKVHLNYEIGYGDTEDEAITQLALKLGIKLWNEESTTKPISA